MLLSIPKYGALHGVSKTAVQKWNARGILVVREGKIDVEASDRRLMHAGLGKFNTDRATRSNPATPSATGPAVVADPPELDGLDEEEAESALANFVERLLRGKYATLIEATQVKENALALKRVLEARKAAGALVEVELAEGLLFEGARSARDAWLNFPSKIAALLAADLKLEPDTVLEALAPYVQQQLDELGEPDPEFAERGSASAGL